MKTIFLTAFLVAVTYAQTCLDSADRAINGRCFKLVNQQMSWTDARDWCHHRSPVAPSYLATVLDTTTSNFLASYARTAFNTNEGYYWIGLSRYNTSSRWQWDDGTPVSWTNFDKNNQQPYNYVDGSITNGKFYTSTNDHKYNFICSYNPNAVQTAGTTVTTGDTTTPAWTETEAPSPTPTVFSALVGIASSACFDNGDKEIGGGCYKFVAQKMSFADARNWCHYQNPVTSSYLAYVPNQFTANFLASYARSAFGSNDGSFWIGLSRKSGGPWTWDNGFPVTYTNFGDQLGNNYMGESIVNAKWNTFGDTDKNFFVCSYDPAAPPTFSPMSPTPSILPPTMQASTQPVPTTTELCEGLEFCQTMSIHFAENIDKKTPQILPTPVYIETT